MNIVIYGGDRLGKISLLLNDHGIKWLSMLPDANKVI